MATESQQYVRFLFLAIDPAWRRLPASEQARHKAEFGDSVLRFHGRLLLRSYSLSGTRGDADLLLWVVADDLEMCQAFQTMVFSTALGSYLRIAYSYLGMTRRSIYRFPDDPATPSQIAVQPQDSRFLFVYPFVKTRAWYALSQEERQEMMQEHVTTGRRHPDVRLNTIYSYGLDDQEFVLAFESDDPGDFLDLVMELRATKASGYTLQDTPIFTCIQMSLWDALDSLGGSVVTDSSGETKLAPTVVARLDDLEEGVGKRVYCGHEAIALFKIEGQVYAVADRCSHGRASLSEGSVDPSSCVLQCPWHGGAFNLESGEAVKGPPRVPIKTFPVIVEEGNILVG